MNSLPWNLIRSFLVVAHEGSVSAAAKTLNVSQPTLSRDIQAIEAHTKLNLFKRSTQGLTLTEAGEALVESATKMDEFATVFERQASGLSTELKGDIRISANEIVGIYLLPPVIAKFREKHPGVNIEIVITNQTSSLNKREADVALRMFRPTQPDLVARRLPDMPLGFYVHEDYIKRNGIPESVDEFKQHNIIGMDQGLEFIDGAKAMGFQFVRDDFCVRSDNLLMQINLARNACGIVGTHIGLTKCWPELMRVLEWVSLPALEFWLVCHADTQHNVRIRELRNFLIEWFKDDVYHDVIY